MSGRALRALLVGIDAYQPPVPALNGCVNDVEQVARWLTTRAAAAGDHLELVLLRDQEARRDAVIEAVRTHLGAAGPEDAALLYYSGHGSQERAVLPEHLAVEPDGLNETIVLADSRRGGVPDLADKELASLVGEVAARAGHVLVVLDCCHSGSGVRALDEDGIAVRRAPTDQLPRTPDSYLAGSREVGSLGASGSGSVLLAACQPAQTAKEVLVDGRARGAFSVALERALSGLGARPTYLDVQRAVSASVRNLAVAQWPVLEAPHPDDVNRPFLGGLAALAAPLLTASFVDRQGWVLDAGRLHGIGPRTPDAPTRVSLYPMAASDAAALTWATVVQVGAVSSVLDVADPSALDRASTYRALLTAAGQPLVSVAVAGVGALADQLRRVARESAVVRLVDGEAAADLVLSCQDDRLRLTRPGADRPLAAELDMAAEDAARLAVRTAEHIGRWLGIATRQNPTSRIGADEVRLLVYDAGGAELGVDGAPIELCYGQGPDGTEANPVIAVHVVNTSRCPLHCAVLTLSELYGVSCLTVGGSVLLEPGERSVVTGPDGEPRLQTSVPDGQERTTDLLKLLVSTEPFDAQSLAQEDLQPPSRTRAARLAEDQVAKGIGGRPVTPSAGPDWATREVLVTTVRPGQFRSIPHPTEAPLPLADGVELLGHAGLTATARLAAMPTAARATRIALTPPALLDPDCPNEPFGLAGVRAVGEELTVLELGDVANASAVTPAAPLRLRLWRPLAPGELVLPVGFDGEDYLPLGFAAAAGDGTEIRLTRLPLPGVAATRSLGGALKILFRKLVLSKLGAQDPYPLLSVVTYPEGRPNYRYEPDQVREAVSGAERVLLVVHGIIGDTRGMTAFLGSGPDPIPRHYDAVLAFDYESINTRVDETAAMLAARIAEVGLGSGRRVDVLAHSMGGLVARWWIERVGGDTAVRRLVTCGTPHEGSPWPRVEDLATATLGLGLNGLGPLGSLAASLVAAVEVTDAALDDMRPGSKLLTELAGSAPPAGVAYTAITGDVPFHPGAASHAARVLGKLGLPELAVRMLFDGTPNDVAVAVASAGGVGQDWPSPPVVLDANCNHFEYFTADASAAVRLALGLPPL
jgi:Caspase domain/PGAP1-like protein